MKAKIWLVIAAVSLTGFVPTGSLGAASYLYHDLNPQGATATYQFTAINDAKQIVGNINRIINQQFAPQAFLWTSDKGYTLLKPLGTNTNSQAFSINKQGQIVGSSVNANGHEHACLWTDPAQLPTELVSADDPTPSGATGINDAGLIVGYCGDFEYKRAYKWTALLQKTDLGTLGGSTSCAWAVNNAGKIVGEAADGQNITRACFWDSGSLSPQSLGLNVDAPLSSVNCINNQGNMAGYYSPLGSGDDDQAFYWDQQRKDITPELYYNCACGISDANQVVGLRAEQNSPDSTFLFWNPSKGTQDLNKLVVNLPVGVTISNLFAISPQKGYLAGMDSNWHPCLLTPVAVSLVNILLMLQ